MGTDCSQSLLTCQEVGVGGSMQVRKKRGMKNNLDIL